MTETTKTPKKNELFFAALASGATIGDACLAAGYSRGGVFRYKTNDPEFARLWKEADDAAVERMEQEADRRAIEGTLKPVFNKGVECGYIREFSDTLLIFRLKGKRPEIYRDNVNVNFGKLSDADLISAAKGLLGGVISAGIDPASEDGSGESG